MCFLLKSGYMTRYVRGSYILCQSVELKYVSVYGDGDCNGVAVTQVP